MKTKYERVSRRLDAGRRFAQIRRLEDRNHKTVDAALRVWVWRERLPNEEIPILMNHK